MVSLRRRFPARLAAVAMIPLVVGISAMSAWPATSADASDRPLRIVTRPVAPFVLPETDAPAGFSIDLWSESVSVPLPDTKYK